MEEEALREAMEDAFLEGAVKWRAETILETLGMNKLDAWIRQAGLADHIEALKSEILEIKATASDVKGRAIGNRRLARSLGALKQKLFDADDAVDELDYYRLRHQVELEEVTLNVPEGMHEAAPVNHGTSSGNNNRTPRSVRGKKRSKAWDDFDDIKDGNGKTVQAECRHCKKRVQYKGTQGTRVLTTHVNSAECQNTRQARPQPPSHSSRDDATENATPVAAINSSSRKRMRTNQEPTQITAAIAYPWNKDEFSSRMQEITRQLHDNREDVTKNMNMLGSDSGASSSHHQSSSSDPRRRTSSFLQGKVYGRDEEKRSIIKLMRAGKSDSVIVLPIVGIGGTGKTALAQFVCNDPNVQNLYHIIWVWVSNSFDEMRISREMLDVVPQEKHEGLCSLDKVQQVLKTHIESKRVLLILDDVWDDMNDCSLDLILAPFKSNEANGNVVLVTTRNLSVAKRMGTTEPFVLGALEDYSLWLLLKARTFRDENYEGHGNLTNIGQKIALKLKGNPLAAVTAGELLRVDLTFDHWNKILKDEDWKLLGLSGGIMSSLKLSYDQLPYHLHQCISYCSIFPDNHLFLDEELVHMWISQGFVTSSHSSKRLEEIGMDYLADLVNLGYFQQVGREDFALGIQNSYVVSGLIHDFARMVSRAECGIVDGLQCNDMLSTVQHLAIVHKKDQHGNMSCSSKFEEDLRNAFTSVRKLRTLLLIGQYDSSCFQSFEEIFQKAHYVRLLQISATSVDFNSLICSSVNPTHLRYLKLMVNEVWVDLPQILSSFCHLQVLDAGSNTHLNMPDDMYNLVSLRHLVAASIARIGKLTSLQKLKKFSVQNSIGFQIVELQTINELVQLGISELQYVKTRQEASEAGLRYKQHLEKLHLSWNMSNNEYVSDDNGGCLPTEVLECLEPHNNLKHLGIFGYNGATSPSWLASNIPVTSLQSLHLEDCGEWRILPSLEGLPYLSKLNLSNMSKVEEVSVPSLEELVLVQMPKLERCSCISFRDLNSCLRALTIEDCPALEVFDLFEYSNKFKFEQKSWLPSLCKLTISNCPLPHPLPSSSTVSSIFRSRLSKFPRIGAFSCESLTIGKDPDMDYSDDDDELGFDEVSDNLFVLDGNILPFHNLRFLTELIIGYCENLMFISFKGLSQLESLETLKIAECPKLSGFDVPPEHTPEDLTTAKCNALPSLEYVEIYSCGIAWEWLSLILQHAPALTELDVLKCPNLESLQLNSCTALEKLHIQSCTSLSTIEGFQSLGSLNRLCLYECRGLYSYLEVLPVQDYELCPQLECLEIGDFSFLTTSFCKQLTSLQRLVFRDWDLTAQTKAAGLTDEQERELLLLGSLTNLQFTGYKHLKDLPAGLHKLRSLRLLEISSCPSISGLPDLPPSLEELIIFQGSEELKRQSKSLPSGKLKVKIDFQYVN